MNKPRFVMCVRSDAAIAIKNQLLRAFVLHTGHCSQCGEKVMLSGAKRALLIAEPDRLIICMICAAEKAKITGAPLLTMTAGQLREAASLLDKLKAQNN